ncbi:hypothetical protein [Fumia xinanensis]|uniref:Uncharacterized protein n=1 Tax=Fumia xinanensis TaxID=2763659 RepID=A0A926DZG7_9FIRM|nr:hypothetical protein [Fumia xinanensis]MBC8558724.1 hypothetical protein [Fumia xinanensis]
MFGKWKKEENKVQIVDRVCPRCGCVDDDDISEKVCPFCGYQPMIVVGPTRIGYALTEDSVKIGEELRRTYCPTSNPAYNAEWYDKYQKSVQEYLEEWNQSQKEAEEQKEIEQELKRQERIEAVEKSLKDTRYIPKCPTCGSPDIRKAPEIGISTVYESGLVSIYDCVRKQFECNNCGYKW